MRTFKRTALMAGMISLMAAGSAMAQPESVNVTVSPAFANEAAKLGQRDVEQQISDLTRRVEQTLTRENALNGAKIELVITDLKPNRPTMEQMTTRPGLDPMRSISIGGAAIEGNVTLADGTVQPVKFQYYTPTLRDAQGSTTWTDANRAYNRLANNLANGRFQTR